MALKFGTTHVFLCACFITKMCLTLCDPVDYSLPVYTSLLCVLSCFSHVRLSVTSWTVARQAALSMGFSRQEYWSGLPFPSPGDLPDPGIEPGTPALQADSLLSELPGKQICIEYLPNDSFSSNYLKIFLNILPKAPGNSKDQLDLSCFPIP